MPEKRINGRAVQKHDIEANWLKATNFTPLQGEIIIYDKDGNYDYERIKIGDGSTLVSNLPFVGGGDSFSPVATTVQELIVPANNSVTYTLANWNYNAIQSLTFVTHDSGITYPSCEIMNANNGTFTYLETDVTYDVVEDLKGLIDNGAPYPYVPREGGNYDFEIVNRTSSPINVLVEEARLNAEMLEYFATKSELEVKADIEALEAKANAEDVEADISAINSELANKINISDAENMINALDNGNVTKTTNLTIPSGGTATYTFLWEESGLPNTQFSCDNPAAISSPTEEYTGVRIAGKNNSTMSHIVCGEEPVVISEIGESTLIYGGGFTKGAENTFTIHNHTSTEVVVKVEEFESSKIDERLTALESNKKVPATFNSSNSSLDNSSTEFVVSSGGNCEPWVEFDVGMPYNDSTSVINNGSSFGGYLTTRCYLQYMGSVENSNIARHQTVIVVNTNTNKDEIYIRRGYSGITVVSQNTDGSYVCKSNNSWTNTTWVRIDAGALEGRIAALEATLANIQNAEEVSF